METLADFVNRLSKAIGCYYHQTPKAKIYSLKKYDTTQRGIMGVFGWVVEKKRENKFEIESYKDWADKASVTHLADKIHNRGIFNKGVVGILFYVMRGSHRDDYKKAVTALNAIKEQIH